MDKLLNQLSNVTAYSKFSFDPAEDSITYFQSRFDDRLDYQIYIVHDNYRFVLLVCTMIASYYFSLYYIFVPKYRHNSLKKSYLSKRFAKDHAEMFWSMGSGGHPDMGSGRYVFSAGYRCWMEFNQI